MAWENLEAEIAEEFADQRPNLSLFESFLRLTPKKFVRDEEQKAWRSLQSKKKNAQDTKPKYTIRAATRVYQRGAVCANDVTGQFLRRTG
jgi:hypothetical protein